MQKRERGMNDPTELREIRIQNSLNIKSEVSPSQVHEPKRGPSSTHNAK